MSADPYAVLGVGYAGARTTDPRWAALVDGALGAARTVVDVGAGTGSYEPATTVLAVEPSPTMIAQRPPGAAPVERARAEALPLPDRAVDAALAVLTVHHWADPLAGLREMVRVADRQVVLTWDPFHLARTFWLITDYLPGLADQEAPLACLEQVVAGLQDLGTRTRVVPVPVPADCRDGVLAAHWARPHAYLDPAVRAAASGLARLPDDVARPALERLRRDLDGGRWHERHGNLLARDRLDLGYRLVVGERP